MDVKKLYNNKLEEFGENDFRSLNWGDKEGKSARARYLQMSEWYDWSNKTVFEVGCGWGSFFDFGFKCKRYAGIDINEKLIDIAKKKYQQSPTILFNTSNLQDTITMYGNPSPKYNLCISSGVAGNRGGPAWSPILLKNYLKNMLTLADKVLVNFPSNRATVRTEYVEYFSPEHVLGQALNITENVQLIHKCKSDFLLVLENEK